jgi:hypothetical protein
MSIFEHKKETAEGGLISLGAWIKSIGRSYSTAARWRDGGLLDVTNIRGRPYVTRQAIEKFLARAERGDFAQPTKKPHQLAKVVLATTGQSEAR